MRTTNHNTRTALAVLALTVAVFVAGCDSMEAANPEEVLDATTGTALLVAQDNVPKKLKERLVFEDFDAFGAYMDAIINKEDSLLDAHEEALGFYSLRRATKAARKAGESRAEAEVVPDPFFATALNAKGEIQIGDDVWKVTKAHVYKTKAQADELLQAVGPLVDESRASVSDQVEVFDVQDFMQAAAGKIMGTNSCTKLHTRGYNETNYDRRIHGSSYMRGYTFYASAGAQTENQETSWRGWVDNGALNVELTSNTYIAVCGLSGAGCASHESGSFHASDENVSDVDMQYAYVAGAGVWLDGYVSSSHYANEGSGWTATCTTYEAE